MLMPSRVMSTTSSWPVVSLTSINLSPGSMPMAMMPPLRTLAKSSSAVFLTVPCLVAKKMKPGCFQVVSSLLAPVLESIADERGDFFARLQFEQIGDAAALGGAAHVGNFMHALDVNAAGVREEHQIIVRAGGEEVLDEILVLVRSRLRGWSCR